MFLPDEFWGAFGVPEAPPLVVSAAGTPAGALLLAATVLAGVVLADAAREFLIGGRR